MESIIIYYGQCKLSSVFIERKRFYQNVTRYLRGVCEAGGTETSDEYYWNKGLYIQDERDILDRVQDLWSEG